MEQLKEDIAAFEKPLSEEVQAEVADVLRRFPQPF
jgi:aryl-alcohol dehydrogenase-like predicted oxidoreductase